MVLDTPKKTKDIIYYLDMRFY